MIIDIGRNFISTLNNLQGNIIISILSLFNISNHRLGLLFPNTAIIIIQTRLNNSHFQHSYYIIKLRIPFVWKKKKNVCTFFKNVRVYFVVR